MTEPAPSHPPRRRRLDRFNAIGGPDQLCPNRSIDRAEEVRELWVIRRMHDKKRETGHGDK